MWMISWRPPPPPRASLLTCITQFLQLCREMVQTPLSGEVGWMGGLSELGENTSPPTLTALISPLPRVHPNVPFHDGSTETLP